MQRSSIPTVLLPVLIGLGTTASAATINTAPIEPLQQEAVKPKKKSWRTIEREHRAQVMGALTDAQTISCADHGCFNGHTETVIDLDMEVELLKLDQLVREAAANRPVDTHSPSASDFAVDRIMRIAMASEGQQRVLHERDGNRVTESVLPAKAARQVRIVDTLLRVAEPGTLSLDSDYKDLPHNDYGPLTTVRDPLAPAVDGVVVTNKRRASEPSRAAITRTASASRAAPIHVSRNPWQAPVNGNLANAATLEEAFASLAHRMGYRFVTDGPAFDPRVMPALASPVPEPLKTLRSPNMLAAMVDLAGPGLTVVLDHSSRAVSVDFCPAYSNMLKKANHLTAMSKPIAAHEAE